MEFFVKKGSIVREIWGKADTILFIFAGASAEFALNKAVDWLYFTGRLPADPLGRLFSTVNYAREIVFSEEQAALQAIDKIAAIHAAVENSRGAKIPDWAYRDVLFMLIDYSVRSFELLERTLSDAEKEEVFDVFNRVGTRMHIPALPANYRDWLIMRQEHLQENTIFSKFTGDLYKQYEKHLGKVRFRLLKQAQILVVPERVKELLQLSKTSLLSLAIPPYKLSQKLKLDWLVKAVILPEEYKDQIRELDVK
ncbi:oxygenase MpaB family protein [Pedobacter sp. SYSU D00535]|uniref:oxygenase MpaB family protein n=1 Tax=Pedobacter sp. SYSU D00535 TaxID=2810308 RepID=UPI001A9754FA|nr:oxygenase MpaB family protein [Pedobacter sp. SYSU D00535]